MVMGMTVIMGVIMAMRMTMIVTMLMGVAVTMCMLMAVVMAMTVVVSVYIEFCRGDTALDDFLRVHVEALDPEAFHRGIERIEICA